jgi:hypothetical protein
LSLIQNRLPERFWKGFRRQDINSDAKKMFQCYLKRRKIKQGGRGSWIDKQIQIAARGVFAAQN